MFGVQLYKNNARALLSRILSILNLDWLQHAQSVRGVYEYFIIFDILKCTYGAVDFWHFLPLLTNPDNMLYNAVYPHHQSVMSQYAPSRSGYVYTCVFVLHNTDVFGGYRDLPDPNQNKTKQNHDSVFDRTLPFVIEKSKQAVSVLPSGLFR